MADFSIAQLLIIEDELAKTKYRSEVDWVNWEEVADALDAARKKEEPTSG